MSLFYRPAQETPQSKTLQRQIRNCVRRLLGPTSQPAPDLVTLLVAVNELKRAVDLASGGRYGVAIVRQVMEGETPQTRKHETYTWSADLPGAMLTGEVAIAASSQIHEPATETSRRERYLQHVQRRRDVAARYLQHVQRRRNVAAAFDALIERQRPAE